jgi:hypothetical protein
MGFVAFMWALWGVSFVFMAGVSLFAARTGREEEDQLFLADSSSRVKREQDAIAAKLSKIRPLKRTALGLAGATTAVVIVYYVLDMIRQFK